MDTTIRVSTLQRFRPLKEPFAFDADNDTLWLYDYDAYYPIFVSSNCNLKTIADMLNRCITGEQIEFRLFFTSLDLGSTGNTRNVIYTLMSAEVMYVEKPEWLHVDPQVYNILRLILEVLEDEYPDYNVFTLTLDMLL